MKSTSNALLDLEGGSKSSFSSFESKLLICNGGSDLQSQISKLNPTIKKPEISSTSQSQVLDKVKNSWECYKKQTKNWRLMQRKILKGVAELYSSEAVAAAESAIAHQQPVIPLASSSSATTDVDDNSDEDDG
ncbi:hypothetical protein KY285_016499 [Solanum tuberosum]|nr:hypothetical protein KY284_016500 [Solanum tuberosum]KAH0702221.1 hypothetical protein KY285_016499 [Solanum tuberosum]